MLLPAKAEPLRGSRVRQIYWAAIHLLYANNLDKALKPQHLHAGHRCGTR